MILKHDNISGNGQSQRLNVGEKKLVCGRGPDLGEKRFWGDNQKEKKKSNV